MVGLMKAIKSWTGGSGPNPINEISAEEKKLVNDLFIEQNVDYFKFWGKCPDDDTSLLLFNRARYDAHATLNQQ
jgi:hypothetical protein